MTIPLLLAIVVLSGARAGAASPHSSTPPLDTEKAAAAALIADPEAATRAYLDAVPAERRAKTKAYAFGNYVLSFVATGWAALVYAALLGFGISASAPNA